MKSPRSLARIVCIVVAPVVMHLGPGLGAATPVDPAAAFKAQVTRDLEGMKKQIQVMNDMVFSFSELGFQEVETSKYLTGILEKEGFTIERGIAGMPTAWVASWGKGKPVISLGSDID